jgi:xeroderma pigmentosum group C-complementing protein
LTDLLLINPDPESSRVARILGLDYADAVTGFEFRGRHGTAVIKGIVAAEEYRAAIEAVIEGFRDEEAEAEQQMRSLAALRMWKKFMVGLRIKERVDGYVVEGEEADVVPVMDEDDSRIDDSGMESEEYVDDGGGGFFPE